MSEIPRIRPTQHHKSTLVEAAPEGEERPQPSASSPGAESSLPTDASGPSSIPQPQASQNILDPLASFKDETDDSESIVMVSPEEKTSTPPPTQEARTCWICQQDDTEDTPDIADWRSPCPCSLTAHNTCLLEWIANEEAPKPGELAKKKIKCPQCKAPIEIRRPMDPIVEVVDIVQRAAKAMILPTALSAVIGTTYSGLIVYGLNSMRMVFGEEKAHSLLRAGFWGVQIHSGFVGQVMSLMDPFFPAISSLTASPVANLKVLFGLPMIAPLLILLRTKLADQTFAALLPLVSRMLSTC